MKTGQSRSAAARGIALGRFLPHPSLRETRSCLRRAISVPRKPRREGGREASVVAKLGPAWVLRKRPELMVRGKTTCQAGSAVISRLGCLSAGRQAGTRGAGRAPAAVPPQGREA